MDDPSVNTIEFWVIGEFKSDPGHLLLMGADGRWYDYDIAQGSILPVGPSDSWAVDIADQVPISFEAPAPKVA